MSKLQLSFHGTFALKKEDIFKILREAAEEKGLNDDLKSLMARTGLGNCKVGPMSTWATRAGLIKDKYLSPEGKIVWQEDSHLQSLVTEWLMHFYLSFSGHGLKTPPAQPEDWGGWSYLVYNFLPHHPSFTEAELDHHTTLVFADNRPPNLAKNFRIVLRAYTEAQALGGCRIITKQDNSYHTGNPRLPNPYLIGYFLSRLWERDFPDSSSILTETLFKQAMGLKAVLGISEEALEAQLNTLEAYGIIEHRRAVPPFQIIPRWDEPLNLLQKAYAAAH